MYVPRHWRIMTEAEKNEKSHFHINIPILGGLLLFVKIAASGNKVPSTLHKDFRRNEADWIIVPNSTYTKETFIYKCLVPQNIHETLQEITFK